MSCGSTPAKGTWCGTAPSRPSAGRGSSCGSWRAPCWPGRSIGGAQHEGPARPAAGGAGARPRAPAGGPPGRPGAAGGADLPEGPALRGPGGDGQSPAGQDSCWPCGPTWRWCPSGATWTPGSNGWRPTWTGVVLAAAGLRRLGLEGRITQLFSPLEMLPAPAQGALALEVRAEDRELLSRLEAISHRGERPDGAGGAGLPPGCGRRAATPRWGPGARWRGRSWSSPPCTGRRGKGAPSPGPPGEMGRTRRRLGRRLAAELVERYREEAVHG